MQTLLEENASVKKTGGSIYVRIPPTFAKYIDIQAENDEIKTDAKIAMGLGKYGPFLYIYSPKQQRKWQKTQQENP